MFPVYTYGQQSSYTLVPPEYELEHLKLNNKEDIGQLFDITEDKQGYLWLTSNKGLHVFDGSNTVTYKNGVRQFILDKDSSANTFFSLTENEDERFWIQEGNSRLLDFDPVKRKLVESLSNHEIKNELIYYAASKGKNLFFSSINHQENSLTIWRKAPACKPVSIYKCFTGSSTNIPYTLAGNYHWIIQEKKLSRISLDGKEKIEFDIPVSRKYRIWSDDNSNFYFVDDKQEAIYTWNDQDKKMEIVLTLPDYLKGKGFNFFITKNVIYFGSNLSLFVINRRNHTVQDLSASFVTLAKKEAPGSLGVLFMSFFKQRDGSLLVCTVTDIYRIKKKVPPTEKFLQKIDGINNQPPLLSFRGITEDHRGNIYASYYTGIAKKEPEKRDFTFMPVKKYISGDLVSTYSLSCWKNRLLWNNVSIDLSNGTFKYLTGSLFGGHCTQWLQHDTCWLFHWNSNELHCYDLIKNKLTSFSIDKAITKTGSVVNEMNDMIGDTGGQNLWISTNDAGITLITKEGKLLKQYSSTQLGISDPAVTDLELDGNKLWFGCKDGLGVLDIVTDKSIIYKNPVMINSGVVQDRAIFTILPDTSGNFYLGSSNGLVWFNKETREFYNLAEDHPMAAIEFNRASAFKSADNRYYFGTTDGLYSFNAAELEFSRSSNLINPIKLFAISIFDNREGNYQYVSQNLDSLSKLILQPFNNSLELDFSVPEFYKKVYYSYRVKGQNENWTEYKPDHKILLYGLQPGKYILEVKASTGLNDANASYYFLSLEMKQYWYKKAWVIGLFVTISLGMIFIFFKLWFTQKIKRQKALADLRTKISSDLHDDVGSILSGLAMQSQVLTYSAKEEQKESLEEISNMSRDAMEHMRDTVWAIDSRKDKVENLIDRMRAFAEKNLALKNITHEFIIVDIEPQKFIDPEKRQIIYLIFKEAITNITKHCLGNHVVIRLIQSKNNLQLILHDNGPKKENYNSGGLGLANMKMRAEKIGGNLMTKYDMGFIVELNI